MSRSLLRSLLMSTVAVPVLLAPGAAHAGTNGQQLEILSSGCWGTVVSGTMYDNSYATRWFDLPRFDNSFPNVWWKGQITLDCYDHSGGYRCRTTAEVPAYQPGNDWTQVHIEPSDIAGICPPVAIPSVDALIQTVTDPKPV